MLVFATRRRGSRAALEQAWRGHRRALRGAPPRHRAPGARARGDFIPSRRSSRSRLAARTRASTLERFGASPDATESSDELSQPAPQELRSRLRAPRAARAVARILCSDFDGRVLLAADSAGRREVHQPRCCARTAARPRQSAIGSSSSPATRHSRSCVAPEIAGLTLRAPPLMLLAESAAVRRARAPGAAAAPQRGPIRHDPARSPDLEPGAPVVHEDYGVGRYVGLSMEVGGQSGEFLVLEYRDGDSSTCRCSRCTWSARYTGAAPESAPLHKLGTDQWAKRAQARRRRRSATWPPSCSICTRGARRARARAARRSELEYQAFANSFPFEETADQAEAIAAGARRTSQPTSRWTASSAATSASARPRSRCAPPSSPCRPASRSRCWCRPRCSPSSTLQNFRDRFADWPVRVEALSRFRSRQGDRTRCSTGVENGTVDIVIATHRLLHADVRFKDLGLHHRRRGTPLRRARQGAAQGAARRSARADADRDADPAHAEHGAGRPARSVADHHAAGRAARDQDLRHRVARARRCARRALREIRRGGQIYFVHNEVETIEKIAARDRGSWCPRRERARRPRPDARARARAADGRFLSSALQRAGLHDDHRKRHRRADAPTRS